MNLLTGSMTPEQFQQYQQEQQQAFFRWQQSQILNRDLDNLQQNPPSFHPESSQTLTQPQQVYSSKKDDRKKTKSQRGKNVEDEPQEPVTAGRWLPVEEELLATCYVAVSEDNNVGRKSILLGDDVMIDSIDWNELKESAGGGGSTIPLGGVASDSMSTCDLDSPREAKNALATLILKDHVLFPLVVFRSRSFALKLCGACLVISLPWARFVGFVSIPLAMVGCPSREVVLRRAAPRKNMGLLDFVKSADPFRVKTGERHLLRARARGGKISEPLPTTVGKSPTALKRPELQSGPQGAEFRSTCRVPEGFAVVTSNSEHGDTQVSLRVKSPLPHVKVENIAAEFTDVAGASSIPGDNAETSTFVLDEGSPNNYVLCCNLLDHITPPGYWAALRNQTNAGFLNSFNINSAQHACMVSKLCFAKHAEIVALKAKLEEAKKEVADVSGLRGHVSELEVRVVAKSEEIIGLNKQNTKLLNKVTRDMDNDLYPHMLIVMAGWRYILGHGICLAMMKCAPSSECRSAMGKVISLAINKGIQQGLEAGIEHGKSGRSLAQVEAYDLEVENKYVAAVGEFKNVDADSTHELCKLQPSLEQVTIPVYSESDGSRGSGFISHEMLLSDAIPAIYERVERRDYKISIPTLTDDR
ncbi:hypothetical protein Tco_1155973 [Tanacetum coccineum]